MKDKRDKDMTVETYVRDYSLMLKSQNCYRGKNAQRIIRAYLAIVATTIVNGFSFTIPNIGTFSAVKFRNPKTKHLSGYSPCVDMTEPSTNLSKHKFRMCDSLTKKLFKAMKFFNKDYQLRTHGYS